MHLLVVRAAPVALRQELPRLLLEDRQEELHPEDLHLEVPFRERPRLVPNDARCQLGFVASAALNGGVNIAASTAPACSAEKRAEVAPANVMSNSPGLIPCAARWRSTKMRVMSFAPPTDSNLPFRSFTLLIAGLPSSV